ncbi:vitelline envelope sperm lysin receptor [Patella vulgata]|uniref:vitelline envelope sperm lysin receptor n=1 Tax=Patella vulgata TaxID=6465 RepID=UPI00217FDDE2|nr:vitelline envelope sperm lysin receptor [Patella vulgata]
MSKGCGLQKQAAVVILITLLCCGTEAQLKASDFIIQVDLACPKTATGTARIKVLTDIPDTLPFAYCRHAFKAYDMNYVSTGEFGMDVSFNGKDTGCVFSKSAGVNIYSIEVYVPLSGGVFTSEDKPHLVTCSYEDTGIQESNPTEFSDAKKPIEESLYNMGKISKSDVDLYLEDLKKSRVKSGVHLGNTVRLIAILKGKYSDEVSFQAVSCRAIGRGNAYPILVGGCGDGIVISRSKGFLTTGRRTVSPYFRSFRLRGSRSLTFDCTFAICKKNCDGNSCSNQLYRSKRSVRYVRVLADGSMKIISLKDALINEEDGDDDIEDDIEDESSLSMRNESSQARRKQVPVEKKLYVPMNSMVGDADTHFIVRDQTDEKRKMVQASVWSGIDLGMWTLLVITMGFCLLTVQIVVLITRRLLLLFQEIITISTFKPYDLNNNSKTKVAVIGFSDQ